MSVETMNLPGNANVGTPVSEDIGGTGVRNPLGNTITVNTGPVVFNAAMGGSTVSFPPTGTLPSTGTLVNGNLVKATSFSKIDDSGIAATNVQLKSNLHIVQLSWNGGASSN